MISKKSLQLFLLIFQLGLLLGIIPIRWKKENSILVNILHESPYFEFGPARCRIKLKKSILWGIYYLGIIVTRFAFLPFAIYFLLFPGEREPETQAPEVAVGILFISTTTLGVTSLILGFFSMNSVVAHFNQLLKLNKQMCKKIPF